MSAHDKEAITIAAKREWQQLLTGVSYEQFISAMKNSGRYWLAADTLENGCA